MRSLFSFAQSKETPVSGHAAGGRPETLRRRTLANNSKIAIAASTVAMPIALYLLVTQGMMLPFILVMMGLASGVLTLALHHRGQYERAASGQVYATLLTGLVLTIADPAIADFGLAIAVLAPIHAALLGHTRLKTRSWMLLTAVIGVGALGSLTSLYWPEAWHPDYGLLGGLVFAVSAVIVGHSANRLNSAFEVYERAQINAYRHLIEHVQDAVMRFSPDGEVLFISRSAETLFGCRRYELTGSGLGERIHVLDRPIYLTAFADANMGGKARTIEVRMRRDDAVRASAAPQFVWVEASLSPVVDAEATGPRHEVVALFRDITERKDHEIEMRVARKAAEDASSAKSRFLATIGHELRTPLNAIVGFSEMMTTGIGGELTAQHKEYAQLIHSSGHHLLDVVKMLLDMSKLEAGKFELQTDAFEPDALVEPCFKMVEAMAREKHVTLRSDLRIGLPMLIADERACRQILINLLSNAIKFSRDDGVVTLAMWRQGQNLSIAVRDLGIGMDADALARIGEPFFQAQDGLARKYEGTGLGLSIVKGLVELHQGTLSAWSEAGQGTTITVLLPINGPAIKLEETGTVTPLRREPAPQHVSAWQDEKRRAL
jgi:two-component system, cell cycle sensor histidine kinase DivJ